MRPPAQSLDEYLSRYEHVCAAVIAFSSGCATPRAAANIVKDAHERARNWSEWIMTCYRCDAGVAVSDAIRSRHHLKGYMGDYQFALTLVRRAKHTGNEPLFASWM